VDLTALSSDAEEEPKSEIADGVRAAIDLRSPAADVWDPTRAMFSSGVNARGARL
jgi:hypothetical protein